MDEFRCWWAKDFIFHHHFMVGWACIFLTRFVFSLYVRNGKYTVLPKYENKIIPTKYIFCLYRALKKMLDTNKIRDNFYILIFEKMQRKDA